MEIRQQQWNCEELEVARILRLTQAISIGNIYQY